MLGKSETHGRPVYIVDGVRTPFLKARGEPGPFAAADLGLYAARSLMVGQPVAPEALDEVITGCVMPDASEANISRIIALRLGCGKKVPAFTVQRNCASGLQSIDSGYRNIALGKSNLVLAGGTEAMSRAPLIWHEDLVRWLAKWRKAKNVAAKTKVLWQLPLRKMAPIISLLKGLTDPTVCLSMGQTAENLAYRFEINREAMDLFALQSHQRVATAQDENKFPEVTAIFDGKGNLYELDDGLRRDSSINKLNHLPAFFDKPFGLVTAGNSSQVTDGAAFVLLASEDAVKKHGLKVRGKIVDTQWAGVGPEEMGLGPVHATVPLMLRHNLTFDDVDAVEINEAFAAQVLACLEAWKSDTYCKENFDLDKAFGELSQEKLNVEGGAIALGHPVGTSGTRLVIEVLKGLERTQGRYGLATLCIGGGLGGAMLIERQEGV